MKARKNLSTRAASLLLALLLLATAGLTACDKTNDPTGTDPTDTTAQTPEYGGGEMYFDGELIRQNEFTVEVVPHAIRFGVPQGAKALPEAHEAQKDAAAALV